MYVFFTWAYPYRYAFLYVAIGVLGAVGKATWTNPRWRTFATICGALGLGLYDALGLLRGSPRSVQDEIPTNPNLKVPKDSQP